MTEKTINYFRRDQLDGITAPDLSKDCSYAEHIVRARGKRTQLTSVSLDQMKINDFGPALYRALKSEIDRDGHVLVEHADLMRKLRKAAASSGKEERSRALQAKRYAKRRLECLVDWRFGIVRIDRKDLITWAFH
ncbi:hypothetical protein [uncultured Thiocystis sp.]|jgi:hypothetical protein|uniref:hypothetical protein n=1 Tax=uncultured Thiocystis sp. TaxID=1202134 RepID=UPI0025F90B16|nr:hypothetical protein [uncultured Thiocystis sp.]